MKNIKIKNALLVLAALNLGACSMDKDDGSEVNTDYKKLYLQQLDKTNKQIDEYNKTLTHAQGSDDLFLKSARLVKLIDSGSVEVLSARDSLKLLLATPAVQLKVKDTAEILKKSTQETIALIGDLENLYSKESESLLIHRAGETLQSQGLASAQNNRQERLKAMQNLSGLRNLLLSIYEEVGPAVNLYLGQNILPSSVTRPMPREMAQNPVVQSLREGGMISGRLRHALTGAAVANVNVGFKQEAGSPHYIQTTTTNSEGVYRSPYLRAGNYYVDYWGEGLAASRDQAITVTLGQNREEVASVTPPIADDQYRITLSWTDAKRGAVRDVDSYLQIPNAPQPLHYRMKGQNYEGAFLDRDDTDWGGPETTTIRELRNGTYIYYVNAYSDRDVPGALGNSNITVQIFKGNSLMRRFSVPAGQGNTFEVFRIVNGDFESSERYSTNLWQSRSGN